MKHYEEEINLWIDGELSEKNRSELFSHLANCDECSSLYKDYQIISSKSKQVSSMNIEMLKLKSNNQGRFYKHAFYFTAVASVIFFMLFLFSNYENYLLNAENEKIDKNFIQKTEFVRNVKQNQIPDKLNNTNSKYNLSSDKEYLEYIKKLRTVSFTKSTQEKI